jgi:hypothetical protein
MPAMGAHSRRKRRPGKDPYDAHEVPSTDVTDSGVFHRLTDSGILQRVAVSGGAESRRRSSVTHRSPSPDTLEMPCCGQTLSEVSRRDQVTTDPAQVTCRG